MSNENNNGFLYFVVGALFIAVLGLGYVLMTPNDGTELAVIESAAGDEQSKSEFNFEIDDDEFSASQTETEEN